MHARWFGWGHPGAARDHFPRQCDKGRTIEQELKEKFMYVCVYMYDGFEYVYVSKAKLSTCSGRNLKLAAVSLVNNHICGDWLKLEVEMTKVAEYRSPWYWYKVLRTSAALSKLRLMFSFWCIMLHHSKVNMFLNWDTVAIKIIVTLYWYWVLLPSRAFSPLEFEKL